MTSYRQGPDVWLYPVVVPANWDVHPLQQPAWCSSAITMCTSANVAKIISLFVVSQC